MTEEVKTRGICLRAVDYRENDRIITLLTDSYGKIAVRARGVTSPKSKLRHAATPFAFGEYILTVKGGFYTLKTYDYLDSFPTLSENILRYYCGAAALETVDKIDEGDVPEVQAFTRLLRLLSELCYGGGKEGDLILYILDILRIYGYAVSFGEYKEGNDAKYYAFDLEEGGFVASPRQGGYAVRLTADAARLFLAYLKGESPSAPSPYSVAEILSLLSLYVRTKTGKNLHSFFELSCLLKGETPQ